MKSIFRNRQQTVAEIEQEVKLLQRQKSLRFSILMVTYLVVSSLFLGHALELLVSDIPLRHFFATLTWFKIIFMTLWWTGVELIYRNWRKKRLAKQELRLQEIQAASA